MLQKGGAAERLNSFISAVGQGDAMTEAVWKLRFGVTLDGFWTWAGKESGALTIAVKRRSPPSAV